MICEACGTLIEDCECQENYEDEPIDWGDDESVWGYDGDAL